MILVLSTSMEDVGIGQELNITHIKHHMQAQFDAGLLQNLQRLLLGLRHRRDNARVGESVQRAHVVRIPLCVDAAVGSTLEVDHAGADVFFLACAGLAFAVEVPDGLGEGLEDVGAFAG